MLTDLLNQPCQIIRRSQSGEADEYGNDVPSATVVETVCELQQQQRSEPAGDAELSDTRWLAVFPAGTDLRTGDSVAVDGLAYELVGDPWHARNPRTHSVSHVEATLRRTAGSDDGWGS